MERVLPEPNRFIEGAGHWIEQERAAEVNEALIRFLQQGAAADSSG
jgi:pimeloyl-ACP methyl ester carboxylesterase